MMEQEVSTQTIYIVALGAEYTFKATAASAKVIFGMIGKIADKATLSASEKNFLKNASDGVSTLVPVNRDDINEFKKLCKHYGVQYNVFKRSIQNSDHYDVSVRTDQIARVNNILNKMNYGKVWEEQETKKESPSQNDSTTQTPKSNDETGDVFEGASDNKKEEDFDFAIRHGYVPPIFSPDGMSAEEKEAFRSWDPLDDFYASRPELWRPSLFPIGPQSNLTDMQREIVEEFPKSPELRVAIENGFFPSFLDLEEMSDEEKVKEYQRRAEELDKFYAKNPVLIRPESPVDNQKDDSKANDETFLLKKNKRKEGLEALIDKANLRASYLNSMKAEEKAAQLVKGARIPINEK